jgi:hypothetical protein
MCIWSGRQDSNLRPSGPKPDALPGCATPRRTRAIYKVEQMASHDGGPGGTRTPDLAVMSGQL